jgi:steroid 5-alpha reductase family enzyme
MNAWTLLLIGLVIAIVLMCVLWLVQRRTGNAGIVDVGWAATIGGLAILFALVAEGHELRRAMVGFMGGVWGLRLALHIHTRSHGRPEDGRYQQLRREWGANVQARMFRFYQIQAFAAASFAMPFAIAAVNPSPAPHALELLAFILWAVAVAGETAADMQLERWKKDPANKGRTCRAGLWNYSRHPNYFFESMAWCAVALFAAVSPHGYWAVLCPAFIFYLLFKVTGIPATEEQAVRTRGDDYRRYQQEVSAFVPLPRRNR